MCVVWVVINGTLFDEPKQSSLEVKMTLTDVLALVGAFTGSGALLWDVFKWFNSGARLRMNVSPNTILVGNGTPLQDETKRISIEITNVGHRKTTLVTLGFRCDTNLWGSLTGRGSLYFVVPQPEYAQQLPVLLDVGERWVGLVTKTEEIEAMIKNHRFFVTMTHSASAKPFTKRVSRS